MRGRQSWSPAGHFHPAARHTREDMRSTRKMTQKQYTEALKKLGLSAYSAGPVLGISVRQSHRYASGEQVVNATVAKLLKLILRLGLSADDVP